MNGRKYIVVLILLWALIITWGLYLAFEGTRMVTAEEAHVEDLIQRGMKTYAENCVVCHGAAGQGHVGPPLNREEFRGDPEDKKDIFDLIVTTVRDGRPGTTFPRWERLVTGEWASYTAMPTFGSVHGGPLNELYLRAVATFIMIGDWRQVPSHIPPPNILADRELMLSRMADAASLTPEENRRGKEIFIDRGCIACHTISAIGGSVGPDLTQVGAWTQLIPVEEWEQFLYEWVESPPTKENRAPVYWSNYTGPLPYAAFGAAEGRSTSGTERQQSGGAAAGAAGAPGTPVPADMAGIWEDIPLPQPRPLPPTQMPPLPMSDEERADLVKYLSRLGR